MLEYFIVCFIGLSLFDLVYMEAEKRTTFRNFFVNFVLSVLATLFYFWVF